MNAGGEPRARPSGIVASVQRLLQGAAQIAHTRLELAQLELQLEWERLVRVCVRAVIGLFLLFMAAMAGAAWLVLSVPPQSRAACLAGIALACLAGAGLAAWQVRRLARRGRPLLSRLGVPAPRGRGS
ncbi:MAG: hypothetical protein RI988_2702 [Pseudomonadota bacterium]